MEYLKLLNLYEGGWERHPNLIMLFGGKQRPFQFRTMRVGTTMISKRSLSVIHHTGKRSATLLSANVQPHRQRSKLL